jgi:hypothetical protein
VPFEHARAVVLEDPLDAFREISCLADEAGDLLDLRAGISSPS